MTRETIKIILDSIIGPGQGNGVAAHLLSDTELLRAVWQMPGPDGEQVRTGPDGSKEPRAIDLLVVALVTRGYTDFRRCVIESRDGRLIHEVAYLGARDEVGETIVCHMTAGGVVGVSFCNPGAMVYRIAAATPGAIYTYDTTWVGR